MQSKTKIFENLLDRLFMPNPSGEASLEEIDMLFKTNKRNFLTLCKIAVVYAIMIPLMDLPIILGGGIIILHLLTIACFLFLCREHPRSFETTLVVIKCIPPLLLCYSDDTFFYASGIVHIFPWFVLLTTKNKKGYIVILIVYFLYINLFFKPKLEEKLYRMVPEEFAFKYVYSRNIIMLLSLSLFYLMESPRKKLIEDIFQIKKDTDNALSELKTSIMSFSHELRNPINSLLGNLFLAMQEPVSSQIKEVLTVAHVCGEQVLQMVNNVLDLSKAELGNLEVHPAPTHTYEMFSKIWGLNSELIRRKGLNGHLKVHKKVPKSLLLDPYRLNQVLSNLIGNAAKFTDKGSITITVNWLQKEEVDDSCFEPIPYSYEEEGHFEKDEAIPYLSRDRNHCDQYRFLNFTTRHFKQRGLYAPEEPLKGVLKIIVRDTGCGIPKESLRLLFQKFSQVSVDTNKRQVGTGLGLYITKEICKLMGGDIRAYSMLNAGSTFVVCIPTSYSPRLMRLSSTPDIEAIKLQKIKAIVTDDVQFNGSLLSQYVTRLEGEVVAEIKNGHEAYSSFIRSHLENDRVDLVVLDLDIPFLDARIACHRIRQYEREKNLRPCIIIIMGSYKNEGVIDELLDKDGSYKANSFLQKPIGFDAFSHALCELFASSNSD